MRRIKRASERQLDAIFGWESGKMAAHYTKTASRVRLAKDGVVKLSRARTGKKGAAEASEKQDKSMPHQSTGAWRGLDHIT